MNIMLISVGFFFFWENVGVTVGNPRSPWCAMALSDIYYDVRVSVFLRHLVRGPEHS